MTPRQTSTAFGPIPVPMTTEPRIRPGNLAATCRFNQWGEPIPHLTVSRDLACGTGRGYGQTRIRLRGCLNCEKFSITLIGSMASAAAVLEAMLDAVDAYEIGREPQHESFEQPGFEYAKELLPTRKRPVQRKLPRRRRAA